MPAYEFEKGSKRLTLDAGLVQNDQEGEQEEDALDVIIELFDKADVKVLEVILDYEQAKITADSDLYVSLICPLKKQCQR